ncbi:MAG: bifunctional folylpolyglutamate synthase/dihydrofolate synthase [Alphaproteobacteria bacterium]|nr:MAG: bifunctional folylpolyglutamate synthase/dihydrofolate synthase [Alphaproteobacteria bacterium]
MRDTALERFESLFGPEFGHGKPFERAILHATLHALGTPHWHLPPVIHVAGTNGKGSTIAFMRAIAEAAGLRVHAFTKPHLFKLNERFLIGGEIASDQILVQAAERLHALAPDLTQFDAQVASAFLLFKETPADLVLLETGMGGRDDSTNITPEPALTVLTPIGLDHQDALGATLAEIAAHKAGIFKSFVPAIVARQSEDARTIIEAQAARVNASLFQQGVHWDAYESNGRLVVQTEERALDLPLPALFGCHQIDNAGLACAALLAPWHHEFTDDAFAAGIANARWPARLQPLTRGAFSAPIRDVGGEVWVDGGHNEDAARALTRALGDMKARRGGDAIAIIGLRARKDAKAFVTALAPSLARLIAVPLSEDHIAPDEIAALAAEHGVASDTAPSLAAAMQNAAQSPAPRVLISGSFLLAAQALAAES